MQKDKLVGIILFLGLVLLGEGEPLRIRMVRHAQPGMWNTVYAPEDKASWISLGLTPTGRKQADLTGEWLKKEGIPWETIIASPQERASETANRICDILGKTFTIDPQLREIGNPIPETLEELHARFSHLDSNAVLELTPEQRKQFKETPDEQGMRGKTFILKLLENKVKGPVLLVAHGSFIGTTLKEMVGKKLSLWHSGMAEILLYPDGHAELTHDAFPDILPPELLTHNFKHFTLEPWCHTFLPYRGPRPNDLSFIRTGFVNLLKGRITSWISRGAKMSVDDGKLCLRTSKAEATLESPDFPLRPDQEYHIKLHISGTGAIALALRFTNIKQTIQLEEQMQEIDFSFKSPSAKRCYALRITLTPPCTFAMSDFDISPIEGPFSLP